MGGFFYYDHLCCFVRFIFLFMSKILDQVKEFAGKAHGEQRRKYTSELYIVHPVRVMETCCHYTSSVPVLAAALLHDVLEDTDVSEKQMQEFLLSVMSKEDAALTLQLVIELTDVYTKPAYPKLNRRVRKAKEYERMERISSEAQTIKYADIIDNSKEISSHDTDFAPVFLRECNILLSKIKKGDQELYEKALQLVRRELQQVR